MMDAFCVEDESCRLIFVAADGHKLGIDVSVTKAEAREELVAAVGKGFTFMRTDRCTISPIETPVGYGKQRVLSADRVWKHMVNVMPNFTEVLPRLYIQAFQPCDPWGIMVNVLLVIVIRISRDSDGTLCVHNQTVLYAQKTIADVVARTAQDVGRYGAIYGILQARVDGTLVRPGRVPISARLFSDFLTTVEEQGDNPILCLLPDPELPEKHVVQNAVAKARQGVALKVEQNLEEKGNTA